MFLRIKLTSLTNSEAVDERCSDNRNILQKIFLNLHDRKI